MYLIHFSQDSNYWGVVLNMAVDLDFIKFVISLTRCKKSVVFQRGRFCKEIVICFSGELQSNFDLQEQYFC